MITPIFEKLHPIDIDNLVAGRITQHALFRAMQRTLETVGWVPVPSHAGSCVIPSQMYDLAENLNDLLQYAEAYRSHHVSTIEQ
jgi:tryptophan 2,3-dioxygenase